MNAITLKRPLFPYLIEDAEGESVDYVVKISLDDAFSYEVGWPSELSRTLFYVMNGALNANPGEPNRAFIELRHPWARDDEGDVSKPFYVALHSVQFKHSWDGNITFTGWIREPFQFFPPQSESGVEDPFLGAKRKRVPKDDPYGGRYTNAGYPYQPPKVTWENRFPDSLFPVEISILIGGDHLDKRIRSAHRKAQAARKRYEAERRRKARENKRKAEEQRKAAEARRALEAEWIKTEEGQEFVALRAEMKKLDPKERWVWMEKTTPGKRYGELFETLYRVTHEGVSPT